jgi:hypothetical protein
MLKENSRKFDRNMSRSMYSPENPLCGGRKALLEVIVGRKST